MSADEKDPVGRIAFGPAKLVEGAALRPSRPFTATCRARYGGFAFAGRELTEEAAGDIAALEVQAARITRTIQEIRDDPTSYREA